MADQTFDFSGLSKAPAAPSQPAFDFSGLSKPAEVPEAPERDQVLERAIADGLTGPPAAPAPAKPASPPSEWADFRAAVQAGATITSAPQELVDAAARGAGDEELDTLASAVAKRGGEYVYTRAAPPAPTPLPDVRGTFTRGRFTGLPTGSGPEPRMSEVPDPLTEGAIQLARGAVAIGRGGSMIAEPGGTAAAASGALAGIKPPQLPRPTNTEVMNAASDVLEGAMKLSTPLVATAAITAPIRTAITLALATVADKGAAKATEALGGSPEAQRLVGNLAGAATAVGVGSDQMQRYARAGDAGVKAFFDQIRWEKGQEAIKARMAEPLTPAEQVLRGEAEAPKPATRQQKATIGSALETPPVARADSPVDVVSGIVDPQRLKVINDATSEMLQKDLGVARHDYHAAPDGLDGLDARTEALGEMQAIEKVLAARQNPPAAAPSAQPSTPSADVPRGTPPASELDQAARNAQHIAEAQADIPVTRDLDAQRTGRELERRLQAGELPTGTERRDLNFDGLKPVDAEEHKFSSTQVNLPPAVAAKVQAASEQLIPDSALGKGGRETQPHVTVKYGIHTEDVAPIREALKDEPPITLTLGQTSVFPDSGDGDVVKVDVDSPDLHQLNAKIAAATKVTDTHPTYAPHVTLAYVKPGEGDQYAGDESLKGQTITLDSVRFSAKDGKVYDIPLTGAPHADAESGAARVSLGEPSGRGEEVRGGNAEGQEASGAQGGQGPVGGELRPAETPPAVAEPRRLVVDTATGQSRLDTGAALGRKEVLVEERPGEPWRILKAGDQITPTARTKVKNGDYAAPEALPTDASRFHATQRGIPWPDMTEAELRELLAEGTGNEPSLAAKELKRRVGTPVDPKELGQMLTQAGFAIKPEADRLSAGIDRVKFGLYPKADGTFAIKASHESHLHTPTATKLRKIVEQFNEGESYRSQWEAIGAKSREGVQALATEPLRDVTEFIDRQPPLPTYKERVARELIQAFRKEELARRGSETVSLPAAPTGVAIAYNGDRHSIEIKFEKKPDAAVLEKVKAAGYRWAKNNKVWYRKLDPKVTAATGTANAQQLLGLSAPSEKPAVAPPSVPTSKESLPASIESLPTSKYAVGDRVEVREPMDDTWAPTVVIRDTDDKGNTQVYHPTLRMQGIVPGAGPKGKALAIGGQSLVPMWMKAADIRPMTTGPKTWWSAENDALIAAHLAGDKTATLYMVELIAKKQEAVADAKGKNTPAPVVESWKAQIEKLKAALAEAPTTSSEPSKSTASVKRMTSVKGPLKGQKPDWTEIGKNAIGQTLYEDQRGVRSFLENGTRYTEPVGLTPKRGGMEYSVDRAGSNAKEYALAEVHPAATATHQVEYPAEKPKETVTPGITVSYGSTPVSGTKALEPPTLTAAEAELLRRRYKTLVHQRNGQAEKLAKLLSEKATETTRKPTLDLIHSLERDIVELKAKLAAARALPEDEQRQADADAAMAAPKAAAATQPTDLAKKLSSRDWYHGTSTPVRDLTTLKAPFYVSISPKAADYFASRDEGAQTIYRVRVKVRNPFDLRNYADAVKLKDILEPAGIGVELTPETANTGWDWHVPIVEEEAGYDGYNPIDVSYLPKARAALAAAGYDSFHAIDPLENGEHEVIALFDPATQVSSSYEQPAAQPVEKPVEPAEKPAGQIPKETEGSPREPKPAQPEDVYAEALDSMKRTGVAYVGGNKVRVVPHDNGEDYQVEVTQNGERTFEGRLTMEDAQEYAADRLEQLVKANTSVPVERREPSAQNQKGGSNVGSPRSQVASGAGGEPGPVAVPGGRSRPASGTGRTPAGADTRPASGSSAGTDESGSVPRADRGSGRGRDASLTPELYRITTADHIGEGSVRERVSNNLAAISTVKTLLAESRPATPAEQQILVKYVGWGGLPRIFEPWKYDVDERRDDQWWQAQHTALTKALTTEEYARARNSTQNAHYTSPLVIHAMWDAARRIGFKGGSVLEPAAGIGHFVGLAPDGLRGASQFALVEKDTLTEQIAAALYPGAYVQNSPYEQARLPKNHFALAISNVPFGDIPITDKELNGPPFLRNQIHNYFFAKAYEHVAPGGLIAFITSHGTLDSRQNTAVRQYLAGRMDFLGAIRLPYTAFKGNAGTEVVTDIIFLRKRHQDAAPAHVAAWTDTRETSLPDREGQPKPQFVNEYFLTHPEMVLGVSDSTGKMYGRDDAYNVRPKPFAQMPKDGEQMTAWTANADAWLSAAIDRLPANVLSQKSSKPLEAFTNTLPPLGTRPFEYLIHEGRVAQVIEGRATPVELSKADEARVRGLIGIRAAVRQVYDAVSSEMATDTDLTTAQTALTKAYDGFVKKYGFVSAEANWAPFYEDPDIALLLSLEDYDEERGTATKTAIFTTKSREAQKQARTASSPKQALEIALGETNRVDLDRIAELLNTTPEQASQDLATAGEIIDTPEGWQLAPVYLSGNVRVKLAEAEAAANLDPRYEPAIARLKTVVPADIPSYKINVRLGASWIPEAMVKDFVKSIVGNPYNLSWDIRYVPLDARWIVDGPAADHSSPTFSTSDVDTKTLLLAALNDKRLTVKAVVDSKTGKTAVVKEATALARQKREDLHKAFSDWLFTEDEARRNWAVRTYNDRFNALVEPKIDGSYLAFPGMDPVWRQKMTDYQRNGVARTLLLGNTLYAWVVGAGKTISLSAAGMELRRLGLARKPLYVVPNHLIAQWPSEFLQYYPKAKVLVARPQDLEKENRRRFTARIASGDWDAVIMPYTAFVRVSMSREAESAYHQELLAEIEQAILEAEAADAAAEAATTRGRSRKRQSVAVKQLEKMRDRIQKKLDKLADRPKDDMLTFEQLGVDALMVDEAHSFKNLYFHTRQQAAGIPADNDAQRATDLYLKARYINKLTNHRNIVFATGTPVSNSMAEIFVMQKFLQEHALTAAGIDTFDAWLAQFGLITVETELDPSGTGLKPRPRLSKFRNLPDLAQMFRQVADVRMIDDLPLLKAARPKLEGGSPSIVDVPLTAEQVAYLDELKHRADNLDPKDRRADNMAKITVDGRMSALDMRLIDRRTPDDPGSKLHRAADRIVRYYNEWKADKGTQVVFLDSGTPGSEKNSLRMRDAIDDSGNKIKRPPTEAEKVRGYDLYNDLKKKLVAGGIPAKEIAFIHDIDEVPDKKRDAARKALFRKVREGEVRVLIGSSNKMGTGMNVQDRLVAEHNLDPTYKPSETEQRYGRILRRGNKLYDAGKLPAVRIENYITTGIGNRFGMDAFMWQLNEAKAKIIADFFKGDLSERDLELDLDQTVLTAGQFKAVATGNPLIIEHGKAEAEVQRLNLVRQGHEESQREAKWRLGSAEQAVKTYDQMLERHRMTEGAVQPAPAEDEKLTGEIEGKLIEGHKAIGEAILAAMEKYASERPRKDHPAPWKSYERPSKIGTLRGLSLWIQGSGDDDQPFLVLRHPDDEPERYRSLTETKGEYNFEAIPLLTREWRSVEGGKEKIYEARNPVGLMTSVANVIDRMGTPAAQTAIADHAEDARRGVAKYEKVIGQAWTGQKEYDKAVAKLEKIEKALGINKDEEVKQQQGAGDEDDGGDDGGGANASFGRYREDVESIVRPAEQPKAAAPTTAERRSPPQTAASGRGTEGSTGGAPTTVTPPTKGSVPVPANVGAISPIEFPELVEFARELARTPQVVQRFRKDGKMGEFRGDTGQIRLHADLFKTGNERQLAAALAHEIGHLVDWLPDKNLKRGNLLGRLQTLAGFLKHSFSTPDGAIIRLAAVRAELRAVSEYWRPWDPATASPTFKAYRNSSKELYADALSMLLNDPGRLESMAPTFYKTFFQLLDEKPDVATAFFELQELLSGTREELIAKRRARLRQGFAEGTLKSFELQQRKLEMAKDARRNLAMKLRYLFIDKNAPLVDLVRETEKQSGAPVPEDENPLYLLSERNYVGGRQKAFLERTVEPIFNRLNDAGIAWETDFGEALLLTRVVNGDRSELANPFGLQPAAAQEQLDVLKTELGPDKWDILTHAMQDYRTAAKEIAEEAYLEGLYTDDMHATMQSNPAYAPFQVVEYMDKDVNWTVKQQKGTLKATANPADTLALKLLSTIRAIERNAMVRTTADYLKASHPTEVAPAETKWNGHVHEIMAPQARNKGQITYYVKGKRVGYDVDEYVANSVNNESIGRNRALMVILNLVTGAPIFRPLFTTFNPGFMAFNAIRDFRRFWRNTPGLSLGRAVALYKEAYPAAKVRAFGVPEGYRPGQNAATDAARETIMASEEAKILGVTYNDLTLGSDTPPEAFIETIFAQSGIRDIEDLPKSRLRHVPIVKEFLKVLDTIREVGDLIETLPKVAAINYFRGDRPISDLTPPQREFIRENVGSPDFQAGGTMTAATNKIFLYSNAAAQGWRSDWGLAFHPGSARMPPVPKRRGGAMGPPGPPPRAHGQADDFWEHRASGFWWKMASTVLLPKLLMWAAFLGLFGEAVKRILHRGSSEYDRTNYLVMPIGQDGENGVVLRLPDDETNRFMGGLFWKALMALSGDRSVLSTLQQVLSYTGGQLPSIAPIPSLLASTGSYVTGNNPYDFFRGRNVLTDDEQAARGWHAAKKMIGWEFQELGGGIVWKFYAGEDRPREDTKTQVVLNLPVVSNVVGRFIKSTTFGEVEELRQVKADVQGTEAEKRLRERDAVSAALRTFMDLTPPERTLTRQMTLANEVARDLYGDKSPKDREEERKKILKKIQMGAVRGQNDPLVDAVLSATSNQEKVALILKGADGEDPATFAKWLVRARNTGVVSPELMASVTKELNRRVPAGTAK